MATYTPDEHVTRVDATQIDRAQFDRWNTTLARPAAPNTAGRPAAPNTAGRPAAPVTPVRPVASTPVRTVGVGVDPARLWAGGAATAIVAALVALVGVLVCRWLVKVPVLAPANDGAFGDVHTIGLILISIGGALAATGLMHLLMETTLRPRLFFGWIVGLVTLIAVMFPFGTTAALDAKIAAALVNLAIGVAIGTLVGGVAARSLPRPAPVSPYRYDHTM
jgi:Family of unknown function (DUF6069)